MVSFPKVWLAVLMLGLVACSPGKGVSHEPGGRAADEDGQRALLAAPRVSVRVNDPGADGFLFVNNGGVGSAPDGPEILTKAGQPVWFRPLPKGQAARNFQVQRYQGKQVLTWWQGVYTPTGGFGNGHGVGKYYIADERYKVIATVDPEGLPADSHEFRLTPDGRALVTSYRKAPADLTALGGPEDGQVWDCEAAVVDVATQKVLFRWDALEHVPVSDTFEALSDPNATRDGVFNPYQMNAVTLAPDGNLLVSLRNTSALYAVNAQTGETAWQLGGKRSSFAMGPGTGFAFQHDPQFVGPDAVVLFNDNSDGVTTSGRSSVQWIGLDLAGRTARLIREQAHPADPKANAMGNPQILGNGDVFSGWGNTGRIAEFAPDGKLVYDAVADQAVATYRVFLQEWAGEPSDDPVLVAPPEGGATLSAVWNGATKVARWQLLRGESPDRLSPVAESAWDGLATAIRLPRDTPTGGYFQVVAFDANGAVLGRSASAAF